MTIKTNHHVLSTAAAAAAAVMFLQLSYSVSVVVVVVVDASPVYQVRIPNGALVAHDGQSWPAVGHTSPQGAPTLNDFGVAFQSAGHAWTVDLCRQDSDGDGLTNGQELGDPDCIWAPGQTPTRTTDITHPGFFTTTTATTTSTSSSDGSSDDNGNDLETETGLGGAQAPQLTLPSWLVWHIALMQISWGFLLPLGALIAISFRGNLSGKSPLQSKPWWFALHIACQVVGAGCMVGGFVVAFTNITTHFNNVHKTFGVAVVAIGCVQFLMGFIRPNKPANDGAQKTMVRTVWEVMHKYLMGRVVIVLAWTNIFLGVNLVKDFYEGVPLGAADNIYKGMNIVLGLQAGLCTILTAMSVFYKSAPPSKEDEGEAGGKDTDENEAAMNATTRAFSIDQTMPRNKRNGSSSNSSDEEAV